MAKRRASILCAQAGNLGMLHMPGRGDKKKHPADGARIRVVTNRHSGVLVELTQTHGIYDKGDQLQVHQSDIVTGTLMILKLNLK